MALDLPGLVRRLSAHDVAFVVIGGIAATMHGSAHVTYDLDIVYQRTPENIERLVRALEDIDPYLRGVPPGLPFTLDAATVTRGLNFTLTTTMGDLGHETHRCLTAVRTSPRRWRQSRQMR